MITLPRTAMLSRGRLRAFWLAAWLLIGGVVTVVFGLGGRRARVAGALGVAAGVAPGLMWPSLARWPYRGWNYGARGAAGLARRYITWVAHTTATTPMHPETLGAVPAAPPSGASRWVSRGTQPPDAYFSASADPIHRTDQGEPLRMAYRWARDTGRPHGRWLVACLAALRWVQPPADSDTQPSRPTDTYTLY